MKSFEELTALVKETDIPDIPEDELNVYVDTHMERLYFMYQLLYKHVKLGTDLRILDAGAKPYVFITMLLAETEADVTGLGYTIDRLPKNPKHYVSSMEPKSKKLSIGNHSCMMHQANIEMDEFPLEDSCYTGVFCMETFEHLTFNPSHALWQINRVLEKNGTLYFSVPNALYWPRLLQLFFGKNIDDPYSFHGPSGRHNRLFTQKELKKLMADHGFEVIDRYQKTFYPKSYSFFKKIVGKIGDFLFGWTKKRGRTIVLVCKKIENCSGPVHPTWLYH